MPKVRANGVEINYEVHGEGTPLLFIHGGFGGAPTTLVTTPRLVTTILPADRVQTIVYDRRGAGQSEYVLREYSLPDLAADARALLDQLGIDRSIVVGDSMGGMVALQYALSYPQRVDALCLVETGPDLMSETPWGKQAQALVERARRDGDEAIFKTRRAQLRTPPEPPSMGPRAPGIEERMRAQRQAYLKALATISDEELSRYFAGGVRNQGAFVGHNLGPRLGELTVPVCIIHGNADTVVPFAYAQTLRQGIPQAESHEIEGAGHGLLMWPEAADALRDWALRMTMRELGDSG